MGRNRKPRNAITPQPPAVVTPPTPTNIRIEGASTNVDQLLNMYNNLTYDVNTLNESLYALDAAGNTLYKNDGGRNAVEIDYKAPTTIREINPATGRMRNRRIGILERMSMKRAADARIHMSHNHPGGSSFSAADVRVLLGVTPYIHSLEARGIEMTEIEHQVYLAAFEELVNMGNVHFDPEGLQIAKEFLQFLKDNPNARSLRYLASIDTTLPRDTKEYANSVARDLQIERNDIVGQHYFGDVTNRILRKTGLSSSGFYNAKNGVTQDFEDVADNAYNIYFQHVTMVLATRRHNENRIARGLGANLTYTITAV